MNDQDPNIYNYGIMSLWALLGAIVRVGNWRDAETKSFLWWKFITEIVTALLLGEIAVGTGVYFNVSMPVIGAIAGLLGLLGPAASVTLFTAKFGVRNEETKR